VRDVVRCDDVQAQLQMTLVTTDNGSQKTLGERRELLVMRNWLSLPRSRWHRRTLEHDQFPTMPTSLFLALALTHPSCFAVICTASRLHRRRRRRRRRRRLSLLARPTATGCSPTAS